MSRKTYENQSMLVVVGVGAIASIIAATASKVIEYEVKEVSPNVEDHFPDDMPTAPGLYVWEGALTVEMGGWAGSEVIDPDTWWEGKFRPATVADLHQYAMFGKAPEPTTDAVLSCDVPELRLKCYHLSVHTTGQMPSDRVQGHSGHHHIELVDPAPGTSVLLQAWANEDRDNTDGVTLRHLVIEDRHGEHRFVAQRCGNLMVFQTGSIRIDCYSDYASVLPNPGVSETMAGLDLQEPPKAVVEVLAARGHALAA